MSRDLRAVLAEVAPAPAAPVDAAAIVAIGRRRRRRQLGAVALVVAVVALGTAALDGSPPPDRPVIGESAPAATAVVVGREPLLTLDARSEPFAGRRLTEYEGPGRVVAVDDDGVLAVTDAAETLRLVRRGEVLADLPLADLLEGQVGLSRFAFDAEGTLWILRTSVLEWGLVSVDRLGTVTEWPIERGGRDAFGDLRVTGTAVSVVIYDTESYGLVEATAEVVPIVGDDGLAGRRQIEQLSIVAFRPSGEPFELEAFLERGVASDGRRSEAVSLLGGTAVELTGWSGDPDPNWSVHPPSPSVADTSAVSVVAGSVAANVVLVHRLDGTGAAVLVSAPGSDQLGSRGGGARPVLVSPSGAVHVLVGPDGGQPVDGGRTIVRTLLTGDLEPAAP